jgi:tRNA U34 2-thiouridine synthase MnmA/TrmU
MTKEVKALLLMSGGLDSILAAKVLQKQDIQVVPICFKSFFFGCRAAEDACQQLGLKLRKINFGQKHLKIVKSPQFGYGSAMNPCIDCHLLMLKEAKKIMEQEGYDFIATGEVLGERPMSQNIKALHLLEQQAGLQGYLLRPLSAKKLSPTIVEKKGLVDRKQLYGIEGRSRQPQLQLAKIFGIKKFPSPGGGCILTDKNYSKNLKQLLTYKKNPTNNDLNILKQGRIFWDDNFLIVVARNEKDCHSLRNFIQKNDIYLEPSNFSGPSVLVRLIKWKDKNAATQLGQTYLLKYSKNIPQDSKIIVVK